LHLRIDDIALDETTFTPGALDNSMIDKMKGAFPAKEVVGPLSLIVHAVREGHLALTLHQASDEMPLVEHLLILVLHHAFARDHILGELACVSAVANRLKAVDAQAMLNAILELALIEVAVLVFKLAFAMDGAALEGPLVLRAFFEVHHAFAMLHVVLPVAYVHVAVWVLAKAGTVEAAVYERALIADAAIFDEHAETIVLSL